VLTRVEATGGRRGFNIFVAVGECSVVLSEAASVIGVCITTFPVIAVNEFDEITALLMALLFCLHVGLALAPHSRCHHLRHFRCPLEVENNVGILLFCGCVAVERPCSQVNKRPLLTRDVGEIIDASLSCLCCARRLVLFLLENTCELRLGRVAKIHAINEVGAVLVAAPWEHAVVESIETNCGPVYASF
jgi:hypothetical protein